MRLRVLSLVTRKLFFRRRARPCIVCADPLPRWQFCGELSMSFRRAINMDSLAHRTLYSGTAMFLIRSRFLQIGSAALLCLTLASSLFGQDSKPAAKTLIDYFLPMPVHEPLDPKAWGAANVLPR